MPVVVGIRVVPVARGDDDGIVPRVRGEMRRDARGDRVSPGDAERTSLGEVVLHVDDDQQRIRRDDVERLIGGDKVVALACIKKSLEQRPGERADGPPP